ncbi:hypothetical protein [Kitasatospora sp. NPDC088783]|uniref:hypothetical protein n=1 Tax=Kitasatospora sp. NPDC088783 TaxID=3364077 RepID=UPI003800758A
MTEEWWHPAEYAQAWIETDRERARAEGRKLPPLFKSRGTGARRELMREAQHWRALASGEMLAANVPPRPAGEHVEAISGFFAVVFAALRKRMAERGAALLPPGVDVRLDEAEQRVNRALGLVRELVGAGVWSRAGDAAWLELQCWADDVDFVGAFSDAEGPVPGGWEPEGWESYRALSTTAPWWRWKYD